MLGAPVGQDSRQGDKHNDAGANGIALLVQLQCEALREEANTSIRST